MKSRWWNALVLVALVLGTMPFVTPELPVSAAAGTEETPVGIVFGEIEGATEPALYIVQLQAPALASYEGSLPNLAATSPSVTGAERLDPQSSASVAYLDHLQAEQRSALTSVERAVGRPVEMVYQYLAALNAFAVSLSPAEAARVAGLSEVRAVYRDVERELETDVGPALIGGPAVWNGDTGSGVATRGEGIIIGVIDSGINSQHPSFAESDGDGYTHTNPYGAGVYKGWCAANPGFCNGKLIGAYTFHPNGGSPADTNGHGSHTASTAAGNAHTATFNVGMDTYNIPIQGVAPRANIVAYKVCDPACPNTSSVQAINSAILNDDVDVLNYSISGIDSPWTDAVDLAFLDATNAGIFVVASAGNAGPGASTVAKTGPWNAAVAAGTHNRAIVHTLNVTGPTTPAELQGLSVVPGENTTILMGIVGEIRYAAANATGCTPFAAGTFTGSLALIQRGGCTFATKVTNAAAAGASQVVIFNDAGGPPVPMGGLSGTPSAFMLDAAGGLAVRDYIIANPGATVSISASTVLVYEDNWMNVVAGFSSRGPSQFELLKPDFTAPGVNILAAVAPQGGNAVQYGFQQGTSMSSPHVAGAAALMRALHPTWTPSEIQSALASTTAGALVKEDGLTAADPFDIGSGKLDLSLASATGLVFGETGANYAAANPATGGDPKTLNQPSMVNYNCVGTCSWIRTVKSVLDASASYTAVVTAPPGMVVSVVPAVFTIAPGAIQALEISVNVSGLAPVPYAFAAVTLETDSMHPDPVLPVGTKPVASTRMPIVVVPIADGPAPTFDPVIEVGPDALVSMQGMDTQTDYVLDIGNVGAAGLDWFIEEAAPIAVPHVLHDNGPFITSYGDGPGGSDVSLVQNVSLGISTLGASAFLSGSGPYWRIAEVLTVTTPGGWHIDTVAFYGYQTGSAITSTFTGVNYRIWNGPPNDPASVIVYGDVSTNRFVSTYWTGAYRYAENAPGTTRPIMAIIAEAGVHLVPGTYWVDWQLAGSLASGPFQPPITLLGETITGDALQLFAGGWQPFLAGGTATPQGVPFQVWSGTTVCEPPSDISWLSVTPVSGTTAPGATDQITVSLDATGLALGDYTAYLCINSNDVLEPVVVVPVTLSVVDVYSLDVAVDPAEGGAVEVAPDAVTYFFNDVVTLTATAETGWFFTGWSGGATGSDAEIMVTIEGDTVITATFAKELLYKIMLPLVLQNGD